MYVLIDNYDSFTYNLYHYLTDLGAEVSVYRNDVISVAEVMALNPQGIILSPGPATPNEAGICLELIEAARGKVPLFGVCLGHQSIGQVYGGKVVRAPYVMHGKTSMIHHDSSAIFQGIPSPYEATRYHSLIVEKDSLPENLTVTAWTEDGIIMGFENVADKIYSVQYHPESIATKFGHELLANFIKICDQDSKQAA